MAIDLKYAEGAFKNFLNHYDKHDDKIQLKIVHTMAVRKSCEYIADALKLSEEDKNLAILIGLLHDVGRFDQVTKYHSFDDASTIDHAKLGLMMLFEQGMIRDFILDDQYDQIIYDAIGNHNRYEIEEGLDERTLLHAKIIRDADKLDNYRVKLEDQVETMLNHSAKEVGASSVTDRVYEDAMARKSVLSTTRKTPVDIWVSYLAVTFDIYFDCSLKLIMDNHWVEQIADRIEYTNSDTHTKVYNVCQELLTYMKERIGE